MRAICIMSTAALISANVPPSVELPMAEPKIAELALEEAFATDPATAAPPPPPPPILPTTTIQSTASGLCMDVPGGDTSNGVLLWMWECYGGEAQMWSLQHNHLVYVPDPTKCVDRLNVWTADDIANGNSLRIWDCNNGESQQWVYKSGVLRPKGHSSKCVQPHSGNQGDQIEIWDCTGASEQAWRYASTPWTTVTPTAAPQTTGTSIESISSGKCIDLPGGDTSNGVLLQTWDCIGGETQQWSFQDQQLVYALDPNKCVDLLGGDTTNGNQLGLWDCYNGESQQWGFDSDAGTIYLASSVRDASKCVRNAADSGIEIWDCNGVATQMWKVGSKLGDVQVVAV